MDDDDLPTDFSIREVSIHKKKEFASTFFLILHMYIAHMSEDVDDLMNNLRKLTNERNLIMKTKSWVASLICDPIMNCFQKSSIPQWLLQIVYSEKKCNTNHTPEKKRTNQIGEYNQLTYNGDRNTVHQRSHKKRKKTPETNQMISPILRHSHQTQPNNAPSSIHRLNNNQNSYVTQNMNKYSGKKIMKIFDSHGSFNTDDFKDFFSRVSRMTINHRSNQNQLLSTNPYVAQAYSHKILASELHSLVEGNWICDTVINFIGAIIEKKSRKIHVYSTHFMSTLCKDVSNQSYDYTRVARWRKRLNHDVEFLYIPIHVNMNHWILTCLDFSKKTILLWNSSSTSDSTTSLNKKYLYALKYYISQVVKSISGKSGRTERKFKKWLGNWTMCDKSINSPQQGNYDDCGIFTILNMVLLSAGVSLNENSYSQFEINRRKTRTRIAQIIFENIKWNELTNNEESNNEWKSYIIRMIGKEENKNRWNFVNQTLIAI